MRRSPRATMDKMCTTPDTSGLCRATAMLSKQSPKSCAGKPPAHPELIKKTLLAPTGKVHKCILPASASNFFFISAGWAGGFPAHDLGDCLPSILVRCGAHFIHGLSGAVQILSMGCQPTQNGGHAEIGTNTHVRLKFTALTFRPIIYLVAVVVTGKENTRW